MKKLALLLFILIAKSAMAQKDTVGLKIPVTDGAVVYERVFDVPGKSKADLYKKAQLWFEDHYVNNHYEIGIQSQDADARKVVGKGREIVMFKGPMDILISLHDEINIQIDCKDGRYRCRISDMILESEEKGSDKIIVRPEELVSELMGKGYTPQFNKNQARRALEGLNMTMNNTMQSLNKTMSGKDDF